MPKNTIEEEEKIVKEISRVSSKFVSTSFNIGKVIIEEYVSRKKKRTVKKIKIGGLAGGEKFVQMGIMFKFSRDWKHVYGGNDHLAAKAANNELRSLQMIATETQQGELSVPLTCLIDYLGFRLVASAIVPIHGKKSLVTGSHDCGITIRSDQDNTCPESSRNAIRKITKMLNLKVHHVKVLVET